MAVSDFYNRTAGSYDYRHDSPASKLMRQQEDRFVKKYARGKILDAGCGTGYYLEMLTGMDIIGMDISESMIKIAEEKANVQIVCGSAENIPFDDNTFDSILCMRTVLNMCDAELALEEMGRVLKAAGVLITSVASIWDNEGKKAKTFSVEDAKMRMRLFEMEELLALFAEHGFEVLEVDSVFRAFPPKWGNLTPFSEKEIKALEDEHKLPVEKGALYIFALRKI